VPIPPAVEFARGGRRDLIEGGGSFLDDIDVGDVLHCCFVRSVVAHAAVRAVDTEASTSVDGVVAVFTAEDLTLEPIPGQLRHGPPAPHMSRPPLATERVRYVGEPLALVVAETPTLATDAAELVFAELDELVSVIDPTSASLDETLLFDEAGSNVVDRSGSSFPSSDEGDVRATVVVRNQRVAPLALEPIGILVEPLGNGIHVWCGHQAPHRLKAQLARLLDLPEGDIRVTVPNVGGGFGAKGMLYPEYLVVAAAARVLQRPLKWVATRREDLSGGTHGRGHIHKVSLEGDKDGRILRAEVEILADLGAYPHNASMIPGFTRFMATGPYLIPEVTVTTTMVVTNTAPVGTYRGAGRPEATYAMERAIDAFGEALGMDSLEVRRQNLIPESHFPHTAFSGAVYDSGQYAKALELAAELINIDSVRHEQRRREERAEVPIGLGIAFYVERAGGPLTEGEHALVEIDENGDMIVRVGSVDTGQGHEWLFQSIAMGWFDLDRSRIRVISGDTDLVGDGVGTFASRSTQIGGSVIHRCSERLFRRVQQIAADMLEAAPEDIVAHDGRMQIIDQSQISVDLKSVAQHALQMELPLVESETWIPGSHTFPYGVHAAVVELDVETGDVRIIRALAVDDCGRVVDPIGADAQVHGSMAQGIGQARYEAVVYDQTGQLLTSTLVDYLSPRATDLPFFETARLVTPAPSNPLGAKGIGESGCIGFPPALVAAVSDAMRSFGAAAPDMPVHPEPIWRALQEAAQPEPDLRRGNMTQGQMAPSHSSSRHATSAKGTQRR
jgi:carbon-monoxide dehydrogenase large subunit